MSTSTMERMDRIPLNRILPNPEQPRKNFDQEELMALSRSIEEHGVINAIAVEEAPDGFYILVDGERRVRASKLAKRTHIPAIIHPSRNGSGGITRLELALVANLQRQDLDPIEEALGYKELLDRGLSVNKIAQKMSVSYPRVNARLRLLELDLEIQQLLAEQKLPKDIRVAEAMLAIPDREVRVKLAKRMAGGNYTINGALQACKVLNEQLRQRQNAEESPNDPPALVFATGKAGKPRKAIWDALSQVGKVPPWVLMEISVRDTCKKCALSDIASATTCRECPLVMLLVQMIGEVNRGEH